jgi:hypothetical protein
MELKHKLENSLKVTRLGGGPRTNEGKEISSKNAIKHGILSNTISSIDKVDVEELMKGLLIEFNIKTLHGRFLVEQLVLCYVKLARCSRIEVDILHEALKTRTDPLKGASEGYYVQEDDRALITDQTLARLELLFVRYEPQLIKRMLQLIEALKECK